MGTVVKVRAPISCGICKKRFRPTEASECLCVGCRKKLPRCDNCGMVMCVGFGYTEQYACKVGKYSICWGCKNLLQTRGYLRPSETEKLLPSGKVVKVRPALRAPMIPAKKRDGTIKRIYSLSLAPNPSQIKNQSGP